MVVCLCVFLCVSVCACTRASVRVCPSSACACVRARSFAFACVLVSCDARVTLCLIFLTPSNFRHDFHHSHNIGNFGSFFVFWDWMMGTDQAFNQWKIKEAKAHSASASKKQK